MPSDVETKAEKNTEMAPKLKDGALKIVAMCGKSSKEFDTANKVSWECSDLVKETREEAKKATDPKAKKDLETKLKNAEAQFKKFIAGRTRIADALVDAAATGGNLLRSINELVKSNDALLKALPRAACEGDPRAIAAMIKKSSAEVEAVIPKLEKAVEGAKGLPKAPTI